jgi:hypothetical protein
VVVTLLATTVTPGPASVDAKVAGLLITPLLMVNAERGEANRQDKASKRQRRSMGWIGAKWRM